MLRRFLFLLTFLSVSLLTTHVWAQESINSIKVEGNRRVETPTIMSYINVKPGQRVSEEVI